MNRQSRAFLSAQASSILQMIGGRDEVVLIPEDSRIRAGMVDDVYAEMWPELLAPCLKSLGLERAGWIDYLFMVGLDADWRFAIWKLVISAADPLVVIVPDCQPGGDTDALLHRIDWSYPTDYPYFGLTETCGAIELEPLGEPTRAWLNDPPHN